MGKKKFTIQERAEKIINKHKEKLQEQIKKRALEMEEDDNTHYMVYNALGVSDEEGKEIDLMQNKGRFLYKYAGSVVEKLAIECFKEKYLEAKKKKLLNTIDTKPKTFEIDCLVGDKAYEIKWKDATTDGDHINKEEKRVKVIKEAGYKPIRLMFFEPNREQAKKVQKKLKALYKEVDGEYYSGEQAFEKVKEETGIDLKKLIQGVNE